MRKFNHRKVLEIAWNIIYVASFIALIALSISNANENNSLDSQTGATEYHDCENCDEID